MMDLNKIQEENQEEICNGCPWWETDHHPTTMCEGCMCEQAFERWLDVQFEEHGIDYRKGLRHLSI